MSEGNRTSETARVELAALRSRIEALRDSKPPMDLETDDATQWRDYVRHLDASWRAALDVLAASVGPSDDAE